jgi:type VI secretion system protein ImpC
MPPVETLEPEAVPSATAVELATPMEANALFAAEIARTFKPKSDVARDAVEVAVHTLAERALADGDLVGPDVYRTIEALIAALDRRLSEQVNLILHHPTFTALEGAWRGLRHLVENTETDAMLKIRVLNVGKAELHRTLRRYKGAAWDQSPIFRKVYEEEFGQLGGTPYGCLVGDYHFDHGPMDVELLGEMARISAAAHVPFIAGASPATLQMESWRELANPRDLGKIFENSEYAAWRALRASDDARYLGLAMPRFLARLPYGARTNPVASFDFEEDVEGRDHQRYVWANSAYAMAANITRAFKAHGWCTMIRGVESGGAVTGLPVHTFPTDDGGMDAKCPTEIAISDRREAELAKSGFMPLVHRKHGDFAAFVGAQSLHRPAEYDDADATANAHLAARLPYLFASCRFAHYLKCMVRDKVGSFASAAAMQRHLGDWIGHYVVSNPESAGSALQAQKPLSAADVTVEEIEGQPGHYRSTFSLKPHYQLEGMTVSLRLVSRLPSRQTA